MSRCAALTSLSIFIVIILKSSETPAGLTQSVDSLHSNRGRLQMLISGTGAGIDLEDMRANVQYAGGYHEEHPLVHSFWKVRSRTRKLALES